jgi:hypothetical protein
VLFFHACQDKPSLAGYAHPNRLPNPEFYQAHLKELRSLWSGRLWHREQPSAADLAIVERLCGQLFEYERVGLGSRRLRLLQDERIGLGAARCEFNWSVHEGVLVVTDCEGKPTFLAREQEEGVWRGAWLEHERCQVVLTPVPGGPAKVMPKEVVAGVC